MDEIEPEGKSDRGKAADSEKLGGRTFRWVKLRLKRLAVRSLLRLLQRPASGFTVQFGIPLAVGVVLGFDWRMAPGDGNVLFLALAGLNATVGAIVFTFLVLTSQQRDQSTASIIPVVRSACFRLIESIKTHSTESDKLWTNAGAEYLKDTAFNVASASQLSAIPAYSEVRKKLLGYNKNADREMATASLHNTTDSASLEKFVRLISDDYQTLVWSLQRRDWAEYRHSFAVDGRVWVNLTMVVAASSALASFLSIVRTRANWPAPEETTILGATALTLFTVFVLARVGELAYVLAESFDDFITKANSEPQEHNGLVSKYVNKTRRWFESQLEYPDSRQKPDEEVSSGV